MLRMRSAPELPLSARPGRQGDDKKSSGEIDRDHDFCTWMGYLATARFLLGVVGEESLRELAICLTRGSLSLT